MSSQVRRFAHRHPAWFALAVAWTVGVAVIYWPLVVFAALLWLVALPFIELHRDTLARRAEHVALAVRADHQVKSYAEGRPSGIFGLYPPATGFRCESAPTVPIPERRTENAKGCE